MKTKVIVDADLTGFTPFEIPTLKTVPQRGENFKIDETKHPVQAQRIAMEEEQTGIACHIGYVEREQIKNTEVLTIKLHCTQD